MSQKSLVTNNDKLEWSMRKFTGNKTQQAEAKTLKKQLKVCAHMSRDRDILYVPVIEGWMKNCT
jgi:hypothetical protein